MRAAILGSTTRSSSKLKFMMLYYGLESTLKVFGGDNNLGEIPYPVQDS
jgi:hypothetical protein